MRESYETLSLVWAERTVSVSYQANWLNSDQWHIELRCDEPLPVTTTGYRSHFVPNAVFADAAEIRAFVLSWLHEAATAKAWQAYLDDSRQMKLF
jgi:hypothetical protein